MGGSFFVWRNQGKQPNQIISFVQLMPGNATGVQRISFQGDKKA